MEKKSLIPSITRQVLLILPNINSRRERIKEYSKQQNQKLDYVDALRGYAILLVIFAHVGHMFPMAYPSILKSLLGFGGIGVPVFFIVSAFTLFLSYERRVQEDRKPVLAFFIRRFFRIAPLYYFGIIVYSIINLNTNIVTVGNILRNLFFINDLYPYYTLVPGGWSISTEMLFYLAFPFLFVRIKNLNIAVIFSLLTLGIAVFYKIIADKFTFGLDSGVSRWVNFPFFIPFSIPVFGIGISFYYIIFKNDINIKPILLLIIAILLIGGTIFESGVLYMYFQIVAFGGIAVALSKSNFKLLVNGLTRYFGKISYSMYIVHFLIIEWIEYAGILNRLPIGNSKWLIIHFVLKFLLTILLTSGIANIIYHVIEVPGQSLGRRLIKVIEKRSERREAAFFV